MFGKYITNYFLLILFISFSNLSCRLNQNISGIGSNPSNDSNPSRPSLNFPKVDRFILSGNYFILQGSKLQSLDSVSFTPQQGGAKLQLSFIEKNDQEVKLSTTAAFVLKSANQAKLSVYSKGESLDILVNVNLDWDNIKKFNSQGIVDSSLSKVLQISSDNKVAIGTSNFGTDSLVNIQGKLGAQEFCQEDGSSCLSPSEILEKSASHWQREGLHTHYSSGHVGIGSDDVSDSVFSVENDRFQIKEDLSGDVSLRVYASEMAVLMGSGNGASTKRSFFVDDATNNEARIGTRRVDRGVWFERGSTAHTLRMVGSKIGIRDGTPDAILEVSLAGGGNDPFSISSTPSTQGDVLTVKNNGRVGINNTNPQTSLDINGFMKLQTYSSEPTACVATNDGALALTSIHTICLCKSDTGWVESTDGTTVCTW